MRFFKQILQTKAGAYCSGRVLLVFGPVSAFALQAYSTYKGQPFPVSEYLNGLGVFGAGVMGGIAAKDHVNKGGADGVDNVG